MRKRKLIPAVLALSLCGCQLNISYDKLDLTTTENSIEESISIEEETSPANTSSAETTTATEIIMTIASEAQSAASSASDEHEEQKLIDNIKDMELPVDKNGNWNNYFIVINKLFHHVYETTDKDDFGENGVVYNIYNYPNIAVTESLDKQKEYNEKIVNYLYNDFNYRFQMYNIRFELKCRVYNEKSRFVSFEIAGQVYHNGLDTRYQEEKEYRFYFTIDRMTMDKIGLATAYGIEKAVKDIREGNYTVVSADDSVFEVYSDELLARAFKEEPVFSDDTDHYLDYYFDKGKICVCIWVGNEHGGYAILKLNGESELLKQKDKSVNETTAEPEEVTETEETQKSD